MAPSDRPFGALGPVRETFVFSGERGTFTVRSEYRDTSEGIEGVWQIADGIGDYATASGHGAVAFSAAPIPGDGFLFTLTLTGSASNIG